MATPFGIFLTQNYMKIKELIKIEVPKEIDYISNWKEFEYPMGHLILDKGLCGCGFTEYCISNSIPTILCSPRKTLLKNKKDKHPEENVYYFKNTMEGETYDKDLEDKGKKDDLDNLSNEEKQSYLIELKLGLSNWLEYIDKTNQVPKILVTYDSLRHIMNVLGDRLNDFAVVVDEFQSIFIDATFKPEVEFDFVEYLKDCKNVLYLSATPMLENYLGEIDYFAEIPMYKLIWDKSRVSNVRVKRKITRSINNDVCDYIQRYRDGDYPKKVLPGGKIFESHELVVFVNSVKTICDVIKKSKLTPEETNIICSDTTINKNRLKKVKHQIGDIPLEGKPHKMFTFCTRTTYVGSDFFHPSAFTIICCDCNINTLMVDISLDLPQIVGRQRLSSNLFKNEVLFLYKADTKKDAIINLTDEEFERYILSKDERTRILLEEFEKMSEKGRYEWTQKAARDSGLYQEDFLGISKKTGDVCYNKFIKIANQRAFDVSRKEYQDLVTVRLNIESLEGYTVEDEVNYLGLENVCKEFLDKYDSLSYFDEKMKLVCDYIDHYPALLEIPIVNTSIGLDYLNYYNLLGSSKLSALKYNKKTIDTYIKSHSSLNSISELISQQFEIGMRYTKSEIKETLSNLYKENNIFLVAKASDLKRYLVVKRCLVTLDDGKRVEGFEILSKKSIE